MKARNANELERRYKTNAVWTTLRVMVCLAVSLASQCDVLAAHTDRAINNHPNTRRLPFFFKSRSHKSATKAYLGHLQSELETTQRQLYLSHQTCTTLRKRFEEQRKEVLARAGTPSAAYIGREEDRHRIKVQDEEIELLKSQLESELKKVKKQTDHMALLEAELKEVKNWKEEKQEKQEEYKQQVEILKLKLEASELVAKSQNRKGSDESEGKKDAVAPRRRAEQLKLDLENVSKRYAHLSLQIAKKSAPHVGENDEDIFFQEQKQLEVEMDHAIQSAVQTILESIEEEWEEKFQVLERQLKNITRYVANVEHEKDAVQKRLEEVLSYSTTKEDQEILRNELTNELTTELTDKITKRLTEELTTKIEKRLRKKYKKLQQEHHSKASDGDDNQRQVLEAELMKMKEQYESEYALKLQQLQQQNEEHVKLQKERMRKLVRALLERESKQTKKPVQTTENYSVRSNYAGNMSSLNRTNSSNGKETSSNKKKKKKQTTDRSMSDHGSHDGELATSSTMSTVPQKSRPHTGFLPVRGNTAVK
ncbi:hypothetical protein HJC23_005926 [Cyclotella cryptica]|uniref:Uncharacterized protein n=1 Tax=Cyclotella cryptica TaxID=29204 RepID=A0ABD3QZI7_9STRA|eukprot:CCRYP_000491-RA/>CCRYP_000491-RA protein AED:0.10 eAED:0.10 QI:0/-1/0/1/-1/1/1/0/537